MSHPKGFKDRLKTVIKRAVVSNRAAAPSTRILTYHSVGRRDHPMNVSLDSFRQQIEWLTGHHPVITVEDALMGRDGIAITFDDGYRDNIENAHPILAACGARWTLFLVAGRLGARLDHDGKGADCELLSWNDVRSLQAEGVEIGGHTLTHPRLSRLSIEDQRKEIRGCADAIASETGCRPRGFAYPYGSRLDYTQSTAALVQDAGFEYALSNRYGPVRNQDGRWEVRRIWVDRTDTLEFFQRKIDGRLDSLSILDSWAGVRARRIVNSFR